MDEAEAALLVQILRVIYCRSISREFRQPVDVMYPNDELVKSYNDMIQYPMDLGTLLQGAMRRKLKVSNYRDGLKLVFRNAIQFNNDTSIVINVAKHLNSLSCGLFEEAFCQSYGQMSDLNVPSSKSSAEKNEEFLFSRNCRRIHYFSMLRSQPLKYTEVENMLQLIQAAAVTTNTQMMNKGFEFPKDLVMIMEKCLKIGSTGLDSFNATHNSPYLSIYEILHPLLDFITILITSSHALNQLNIHYEASIWTPENILRKEVPNLFILLNNNCTTTSTLNHKNIFSQNASTTIVNASDKITFFMSLMSTYLPYLRTLDENLGTLLVCVYERVTRGNINSSIWATPLNCCWVNLSVSTGSGSGSGSGSGTGTGYHSKINNPHLQNNCLGGWPGMVLVSAGYSHRDRDRTNSSSEHGVNNLLCEANIVRLTTDVIEQLNNSILPNTSNDESIYTYEGLILRDGYILIEYISLNLFEWIPVAHIKKVNSIDLKTYTQTHTTHMKKNSVTDKLLSTAINDSFKSCLWLDLKTTEFIDNMILNPNTSGLKKSGINPDDFYDIPDPSIKTLEKSLQKSSHTSIDEHTPTVTVKSSAKHTEDVVSLETSSSMTKNQNKSSKSKLQLMTNNNSSETTGVVKDKKTISNNDDDADNDENDDEDEIDDDDDDNEDDDEEDIATDMTHTNISSNKKNASSTVTKLLRNNEQEEILQQIKTLFPNNIDGDGNNDTNNQLSIFKVSELPAIYKESKKGKSIHRAKFFGAWASQYKFPQTPLPFIYAISSNSNLLQSSSSTTSHITSSNNTIPVTESIDLSTTVTVSIINNTDTGGGKGKRKLSHDKSSLSTENDPSSKSVGKDLIKKRPRISIDADATAVVPISKSNKKRMKSIDDGMVEGGVTETEINEDGQENFRVNEIVPLAAMSVDDTGNFPVEKPVGGVTRQGRGGGPGSRGGRGSRGGGRGREGAAAGGRWRKSTSAAVIDTGAMSGGRGSAAGVTTAAVTAAMRRKTTGSSATATSEVDGGSNGITGVSHTASGVSDGSVSHQSHDARIGKMFDSHSGCSRYLAGEGIIHTRIIDFTCPIFFKESISATERKSILKQELLMLNKKLKQLQALSTKFQHQQLSANESSTE